MILLDKIIWVFLAIFFLSGWLKGFLKSLIGPFAFICCLFSAIIFYDINCNILIAAVITFAGTIGLSLLLLLLLIFTMNTINKEYRGKVFLLSRILGAIINIAWQSNILFFSLILFSVFPLEEGMWTTLQRQIPDSTMMTYYRTNILDKDIHYKAFVATVESAKDPQELQEIKMSKEYKAFNEDSHMQAFINDPQVIRASQENNMIQLLKAQSLRTLITTDSSMYLFTKLVESQYMKKLDQLTGTSEPKD